jgi:hypothetical protein
MFSPIKLKPCKYFYQRIFAGEEIRSGFDEIDVADSRRSFPL